MRHRQKVQKRKKSSVGPAPANARHGAAGAPAGGRMNSRARSACWHGPSLSRGEVRMRRSSSFIDWRPMRRVAVAAALMCVELILAQTGVGSGSGSGSGSAAPITPTATPTGAPADGNADWNLQLRQAQSCITPVGGQRTAANQHAWTGNQNAYMCPLRNIMVPGTFVFNTTYTGVHGPPCAFGCGRWVAPLILLANPCLRFQGRAPTTGTDTSGAPPRTWEAWS